MLGWSPQSATILVQNLLARYALAVRVIKTVCDSVVVSVVVCVTVCAISAVSAVVVEPILVFVRKMNGFFQLLLDLLTHDN